MKTETKMKSKSATQKTKLIDYLINQKRSLSAKQAKAFLRIANLSAVVSDLRKEGFNIVTGSNRTGKAVYFAVTQ